MTICDPQALVEEHRRVEIAPGTIDLWAFGLDGSSACVDSCREILSAAELARAQRYVHSIDRDRYVVAHGVLRRVLARYCGAPAASLRFGATSTEKPFLVEDSCPAASISFNLAHSHDHALLAIGAQDVGIDIEKIRRDTDILTIGRRFFFGEEYADIARAAPEQQTEKFFCYWVAKEAVLKAQGAGLSVPLDRFRVLFGVDGRTARIVTLAPKQLEAHWTVRMLPHELGWCAAVAAAGDGWKTRVQSARRAA